MEGREQATIMSNFGNILKPFDPNREKIVNKQRVDLDYSFVAQ